MQPPVHLRRPDDIAVPFPEAVHLRMMDDLPAVQVLAQVAKRPRHVFVDRAVPARTAYDDQSLVDRIRRNIISPMKELLEACSSRVACDRQRNGRREIRPRLIKTRANGVDGTSQPTCNAAGR